MFREENPELDQKQIKDLMGYLENLPTERLEKNLRQTREDALKDCGPYPPGTAPGNTTKIISIMENFLEERKNNK